MGTKLCNFHRMKTFFLSALFLFSSLIFAQSSRAELKEVSYEELMGTVQREDGKIYVVNFFATWCRPCIDEIPDFMEVNSEYEEEENFKMILVSLDNRKLLNTKVKRFIEKHHISTDVFLLDDFRNIQTWMPATDERWQGAIPATVIYKNGEKLLFRDGSLTRYELEDIVEAHLD